MRIAAVVNDQVVSVFDLISRMQMVMLSSNIPDTPELRERIGRQVLRSLIDERLQMQEAKRQNVTVSDAEIEKALTQIAQQNSMSTEQLTQLLKTAASAATRWSIRSRRHSSGGSWSNVRPRKRSMFPTRRSMKRSSAPRRMQRRRRAGSRKSF